MFAAKAQREWEQRRREANLVNMRRLCRRLGVKYVSDEDAAATELERAALRQSIERPEDHCIGTPKQAQR